MASEDYTRDSARTYGRTWPRTVAEPTLFLDFARATSLDPRITFSRASTATYFNNLGVLTSASNDVARFDYNPSTLAPRGLLIEEQRTNLLLQSEDFATTWAATNVTVSTNATTAPNGTATADKLIANTTPAVQHYISQTISTATNQTYTFTCFIKNNEVAQFVIQIVAVGSTATTSNIGFTQTAGVIAWDGGLTGIVSSVSATSVGNGWYRCSVTYTLNGTVTLHQNRIFPGSVTTYAGDGTSGVFAWGAQNEAGAFATSYIPTTTTALTRNADVASMTGTNFSSWYNQSEGTVFAQAIGVNNISGATRRYAEISDGTVNERIVLGYSATSNTRMLVSDANILQADITVTSGVTAGSLIKMAAAYKANDFQQASNSTLGSADTSGSLPTVTALYLGTDSGAATVAATLNGWLQRIAYYPTRLPNASLQALTA